MAKIYELNPLYIQYRQMWHNDRWKFCGEMVRLNMKSGRSTLTDEETLKLATMERIVDENNNQWIEDDHPWYPEGKKPKKKKRVGS